MRLYTLHPKHYGVLYKIAMEAEPYGGETTEAQFRASMSKREGFVVVGTDGKLAGCISLSDFVPGADVLLHGTATVKSKGQWLTKRILKTLFGYIFEEMELPRVSSFCVIGKSDEAGVALLKLGFKHEGTKRNAVTLPDGLYDMNLYGMLKDECRWL